MVLVSFYKNWNDWQVIKRKGSLGLLVSSPHTCYPLYFPTTNILCLAIDLSSSLPQVISLLFPLQPKESPFSSSKGDTHSFSPSKKTDSSPHLEKFSALSPSIQGSQSLSSLLGDRRPSLQSPSFELHANTTHPMRITPPMRMLHVIPSNFSPTQDTLDSSHISPILSFLLSRAWKVFSQIAHQKHSLKHLGLTYFEHLQGSTSSRKVLKLHSHPSRAQVSNKKQLFFSFSPCHFLPRGSPRRPSSPKSC